MPDLPVTVRTACAVLLIPALASLPGPAVAQSIANPDLFEKSLEAARQAAEHYGELDDPAEARRVLDIAYRLASHADYGDVPFTFTLVEMPEPNAFALPGGQIFVTRGMLDLDLDDDMLACLLGHEIAHVVFRHGTRMQRRATLLNVLSSALVLGVLVGADDGPENPRDPYGVERSGSRKGTLVQGTAAAGMALSELLLRDYSREFEDEADEEGQRLAAAAGFDPAGAHRLWERMSARIPQSKDYGYWRTHPFSDQRTRAARVRAGELRILPGRDDSAYRSATQTTLLDWLDTADDVPEETRVFVERAALRAWPGGPVAEDLRRSELDRRRDAELAEPALQRDFGALLASWSEHLEEVRTLTPSSPFVVELEADIAELRSLATALYPDALAVWESEIWQTPFLETFLSNWPDAPPAPRIALALGDAYARLGREADAVEQYLLAARAGRATESGDRALRGLRSLAPRLDELVALRRLANEIDDPELQAAAEARLEDRAGKYEQLRIGAEFLRAEPSSELSEVVRGRLESLARNLYGEILLYQAVGDHVKALDRIHQLMTHAPTTEAARQLRERAVVAS